LTIIFDKSLLSSSSFFSLDMRKVAMVTWQQQYHYDDDDDE
jgi:hypothetical protein